MASKAADFAGKVMPGVSPRARRITLTLLTITYFFSYMDRHDPLDPAGGYQGRSAADRHAAGYRIGPGLCAFLRHARHTGGRGWPTARTVATSSPSRWRCGAGATALCGLANSFIHLLLARIGVGIWRGGGGSSPPSHSMIADLYGPDKRAGALAIYSLGVTLGAAMGTILGGTIAHYFGWRHGVFRDRPARACCWRSR